MNAHEDRVERLLALILTEGIKSNKEKAIKLSLSAFTNAEIAELLGITPQVVANYLSEHRREKKSKSK
jgi:DNA-binding CsgD family transcriptional regulator